MDHLTSLLGRCIRVRKRSPKCQYQYHDQWPSASHDGSFCQRHHREVTELRPLPHEPKPKPLTKTSSIRIVETTDSESGTPPPEDTPERRFSVSRRRYSDESVAGEKSTPLDEETSTSTTTTTSTSPSNSSTTTITTTRTAPDTHPRRIEDIPEEDEEDQHHPPPPPSSPSTTTTTTNNNNKDNESEDEKKLPTWRVNRRKSLVEILHLLQSASSTTTPKLSNIKLPSPLRKRGASTTSLPSLSTCLTASTTTATPTPDDTDSDEEVKRQRRMGAIVFPAAMRLRGNDGGSGTVTGTEPGSGGDSGNGGEGHGRKRRPETVIAATGGVSSLLTGKDRTLFC